MEFAARSVLLLFKGRAPLPGGGEKGSEGSYTKKKEGFLKREIALKTSRGKRASDAIQGETRGRRSSTLQKRQE